MSLARLLLSASALKVAVSRQRTLLWRVVARYQNVYVAVESRKSLKSLLKTIVS